MAQQQVRFFEGNKSTDAGVLVNETVPRKRFNPEQQVCRSDVSAFANILLVLITSFLVLTPSGHVVLARICRTSGERP